MYFPDRGCTVHTLLTLYVYATAVKQLIWNNSSMPTRPKLCIPRVTLVAYDDVHGDTAAPAIVVCFASVGYLPIFTRGEIFVRGNVLCPCFVTPFARSATPLRCPQLATVEFDG